MLDAGKATVYAFLEFSDTRDVAENRRIIDMVEGGSPPSSPLVLRVQKGSRFTDMHFSSGIIDLAGQNLRHVLDDCGVGSVHYYPIVVYDRKDKHVLDVDLRWLHVDRRAGPMDKSRGLPLQWTDYWQTHPEACDDYGLFFDLQSWDGADVFRLQNYNTIIVTARIADAIRKARLKNVVLTPILEYGKRRRHFLGEKNRQSGRSGTML